MNTNNYYRQPGLSAGLNSQLSHYPDDENHPKFKCKCNGLSQFGFNYNF